MEWEGLVGKKYKKQRSALSEKIGAIEARMSELEIANGGDESGFEEE